MKCENNQMLQTEEFSIYKQNLRFSRILRDINKLWSVHHLLNIVYLLDFLLSFENSGKYKFEWDALIQPTTTRNTNSGIQIQIQILEIQIQVRYFENYSQFRAIFTIFWRKIKPSSKLKTDFLHYFSFHNAFLNNLGLYLVHF